MSAAASKALLTIVTRQIEEKWIDLRDTWRDQKAADFEQTYLTELRTAVNGAIRALEELDKLLQRIHADCE